MSVHVVQAQTFRDHEDLKVIEQLGDLFSGLVVGLILRGHPHFGSFFDDLLSDLVHARIQARDRTGTRRTFLSRPFEFGKQAVEGFHTV